jgi:hypothetical protein
VGFAAVAAELVLAPLASFFAPQAALGTLGEKLCLAAIAGGTTIVALATYLVLAAVLRVRELNTLVAIIVDLIRRRGEA